MVAFTILPLLLPFSTEHCMSLMMDCITLLYPVSTEAHKPVGALLLKQHTNQKNQAIENQQHAREGQLHKPHTPHSPPKSGVAYHPQKTGSLESPKPRSPHTAPSQVHSYVQECCGDVHLAHAIQRTQYSSSSYCCCRCLYACRMRGVGCSSVTPGVRTRPSAKWDMTARPLQYPGRWLCKDIGTLTH
jgi:hypothetical protein